VTFLARERCSESKDLLLGKLEFPKKDDERMRRQKNEDQASKYMN
jgi:hypothetical protein